MPKVSVFIPVYNGGKFIANSLNSILKQTFQDFEVIVVNDGSTDNTLEVLSTFLDSRISVYSNPGNKGLTYTRNRGLDLAKGEYLAINDCDDFSHQERLQRQVDFLDQHQKVGVVGTSANRIVNGELERIWAYPASVDDIKCRLFWGSAVINPTAMLRMSFIQKHNLRYREEFPPCEDYDFFERAINLFEIRNIPEVLLEYNLHGQNVTLTMNSKMRDSSNVIGLRQVQKLGLQLSEQEKIIFKKALNFDFNNTETELQQLKIIFESIVDKNQEQQVYKPEILHRQIAERWYQMCYHSKVSNKRKLFYKSHLKNYFSPSLKDAIKLYVKEKLSK